MSFLHRQQYTNKKGILKKSHKHYLRFTDHLETQHDWPLFEDERASAEVQRKIDDLVALKTAGLSPDVSLSRWLLEGCPADLRDRLAGIGLISAQRQTAGKSLIDHVADFKLHLQSKDVTKKRVELCCSRITRFINETGVKSFSEIVPSTVERFLAGLRVAKVKPEGTKGKCKLDGIGHSTYNGWLQVIREFLRWARDYGLTLTTLEPIKKLKPQLDQRHPRRVLTVAETDKLLATTAAGPDRAGVPGTVRALLYRLAFESGLRRGELHSLTAGSFDLNKRTVAVAAEDAKSDKGAVLPLRASTADLLVAHLENKLPTARAFNLPHVDTISDVFKADVEAADIPWQHPDTGFFADFHALRHSFITRLAESGVHPKVAQDLARHSDINLTMSYYTHVQLEKLSEAVAMLPEVAVESAADVREGTTGEGLHSGLHFSGKIQRKPVQASATRTYEKKSHLSDLNRGPVLYESAGVKTQPLSEQEVTVSEKRDLHSGLHLHNALSPDLAELAALWPSLPDAVKAGFLATAKAITGAPKP